MRWAERHARLARDTGGLRARIEGRTGSLGRRFDRICELLERRGYLTGDETTPPGRQLARIWSESDLVVAECLRDGAWDGLDPAELAAVVSVFVYEPRRDERAGRPDAHAGGARRTRHHRADLGRPRRGRGGAGSAAQPRAAARASCGRSTGGRARTGWTGRWPPRPRRGGELSPGDFIRWCKQVLDLLEQLIAVPAPGGEPEPVAGPARAAAAAVRRGVVAQSMLP